MWRGLDTDLPMLPLDKIEVRDMTWRLFEVYYSQWVYSRLFTRIL